MSPSRARADGNRLQAVGSIRLLLPLLRQRGSVLADRSPKLRPCIEESTQRSLKREALFAVFEDSHTAAVVEGSTVLTFGVCKKLLAVFAAEGLANPRFALIVISVLPA